MTSTIVGVTRAMGVTTVGVIDSGLASE